MNTLRILTLALLFLSVSCKNANTTQDEEDETTATSNDPAKPIRFRTETTNWKDGSCNDSDNSCLKINLSYPVAMNGKEGVSFKINEHIQDYLIATLELEEPEDELISLEQAAQRFIKVYQEEKESLGDSGRNWVVEVDGQQAIQKNILVIRLVAYTNTGGAHPNVYQSFTNFDLNTGEEFYYEDFVIDSLALQKIVEKRFYQTRKEMDGSFDKDDAFWGKPFYLPENFAITSKGVKFFYNHYEALAYAFGPTEFTINYKNLEGIIEIPNEMRKE